MRFTRTPSILPVLFPWAEWNVPASKRSFNKTLYLTFDDGPVPEATPFVLSALRQWNAKATFFCVGENAARYPALPDQIIAAGHRLGNHTYNHLNGWKTTRAAYLDNIKECAQVIDSNLFRPPYGKLNFFNAIEIRRSYRVVFWDVVSYDFDATLDPGHCIRLTHQASNPGSIVVFHDSIKALPRLKIALPALLEKWTDEGYRFESL